MDDKREDGQGEGSHDKGGSQDKGAWEAHDGCGYRCRRVQLFAISVNFGIDGIDIYDWLGGQTIYRRHILGEEPSPPSGEPSNQPRVNKLCLIGPNRGIVPYCRPKVEIFRSTDVLEQKGKTTSPINLVWNVYDDDDNDYDDPIILNNEINGELPDEKVSITYMVIPRAVEANVEVSLMLGPNYNGGGGYYLPYGGSHRGGGYGYHVSGFIKAYNKAMKGNYVELLSRKHKSLWVPGGKMTEIPIVSHLCLLEKDVEVYVSLRLKPPLGQEEELIPFTMKFNPRVETQERQCRNHKIEIKVIFC